MSCRPTPGALALLARRFAYPADAAVCAVLAPCAPAGLCPEALQTEYVRLFDNALPEVPCPPYGSIYLEGRLEGETTAELARLMARRGLQPDGPADHISTELEFAAVLEARRQGSDAAALADLQSLLAHLDSWTPDFFERVEHHDRSGAYATLASTARRCLAALPRNPGVNPRVSEPKGVRHRHLTLLSTTRGYQTPWPV